MITPGFSYENASHFATLSQLAYEKSESVFKDKVQPFGYKDVKYFDKSGAQCYGLEHNDYIVLSFRGTEPETENDVKADLNVFHVKDKNGRVHRGFRDEVDTLWPDITTWLKEKDDKQIYTCGHSLGGAMSGIAASRLEGAICYNYGCPRIGTNKWRKAFDKEHKMYRFVNDRDIVPRVPPRWLSYKHAGELHFIDENGTIKKNPKQFKFGICKNPFRIKECISDHDMGDYRRLIEKWCNIIKYEVRVPRS